MMVRSFLCLAVVLGAAGVASAEVLVNVDLVYTTSYEDAVSFVVAGPLPTTVVAQPNGTTKTVVTLSNPAAKVHQFEVYLNVSGLAADQDSVAFQYSGLLGGGATFNVDTGGYAESTLATTNIDPPPAGAGNGGSHAPWNINSLNMGTGAFVHDIWRGTTTASYGDYASTAQVGEAAPYDIGTLYLNASGAGTFALNFPQNPGYFKLISNNVGGAATSAADESFPTYSGTGDSIQFVKTPEPSTLALLATGLVGLLAYAWRKRN